MRQISLVLVALVFWAAQSQAQVGSAPGIAPSAPAVGSAPNAVYEGTTDLNTSIGHLALNAGTTGTGNTASGANALRSNAIGVGNTAAGSSALFTNTDGHLNTATGVGALYLNNIGQQNTASGASALRANNANYNSAFGASALFNNTFGFQNTATGSHALHSSTLGVDNTANGFRALYMSLSSFNTASGAFALYSTTAGWGNTAIGVRALYANETGGRNVALGSWAGANATTGHYNVFVGADVAGTPNDTNTIRVGLPYDSTTGAGQNQAFIAGVHGTPLTGSAVQVFVDANGQLGTLTAPIASGSGTTPASALVQQVQDQQATIDDLRARLARIEALLTAKARK